MIFEFFLRGKEEMGCVCFVLSGDKLKIVPAVNFSSIFSTINQLVVISSWCYVFQVKKTDLDGGLVQDEFEKTNVNMSTYLVAFVVADFTPLTKNVSETQVVLTE